jgi:hypothetical protein
MVYVSILPPPGDRHLRNLAFQNRSSLRAAKSFNEGSGHEDSGHSNEQMKNKIYNFGSLTTVATTD